MTLEGVYPPWGRAASAVREARRAPIGAPTASQSGPACIAFLAAGVGPTSAAADDGRAVANPYPVDRIWRKVSIDFPRGLSRWARLSATTRCCPDAPRATANQVSQSPGSSVTAWR